jgi:hypothetical protein
MGLETRMESDPAVQYLRDVVYLPYGCKYGSAGLYDYQRKLITSSVYSRGPDVNPTFPGLGMQISYNDVLEYAPEEIYVYIGAMHQHYGHFLLSTLSRFWNEDLFRGKVKIVCSCDGSLADLLAKEHVVKILHALNISQDRFVMFDRPMKLRTVILPVASFEERNYVHRTFGRLGNRLGRALAGASKDDRSSRPAYFSKSKLKHGVRAIANEVDLEALLEARGVDIVHPQEYAFEDQIRLWDRYDKVITFMASSLHTTIFRPRCRLIGLLYYEHLDTSYTLVDWVNKNDAQYFRFEDGEFIDEGPSPLLQQGEGFHSSMRLVDPGRVADQLLEEIYGAKSI